MSGGRGGRAASLRARLLALAKRRGDDFNLVLNRYATERFLYRLSLSPRRESFCLKGALLFQLWFAAPHRPTRDADFLGFGSPDAGDLHDAVRAICGIAADDGMAFDAASIRVEKIREEARYGGLRVHLTGELDRALCTLQLDVGFGDAVTPGIEEADFPGLLEDLPAPRLQVYPRATVAAEKFEAMLVLGMGNSRMKDYFDLLALAREGEIAPALLSEAIAATCLRRGTTLPEGLPDGLSDEFARDTGKQKQWNAFLGKSRLEAPDLETVVTEVREFLQAPIKQARIRMKST